MPKIQIFTPTFQMKMGWEMSLILRCLLQHQKGTHISFLTPRNVYYKLLDVFGEITFWNHLLIANVNNLDEIMNKFVEGSINVKRNKL
jgi:hypothetical protein